jgi:fused signal recognition particle receptor
MFGFGRKKKAKSEQPNEAAEIEVTTPESAPESIPAPSSASTAPPVANKRPDPAPEQRVPQAASPRPPAAGRKQAQQADADAGKGRLAQAISAAAAAKQAAEQGRKNRLLSGLKEGLARTRAVLNADVGDLVAGRTEIDEDLLEELEILLLSADVGVPATTRIIEDLGYRIKRREVIDPPTFLLALRRELAAIVARNDAPVRQPAPGKPQVILMIGVNGVGKTTTIGKLAQQLKAEGNSVMLAAGDTFRAAAVEQLQVWGARNDVPVIAQQTGADPASVIYDALQAATARGADVLIADTAGRLHTKVNLMEELRKIGRVMKKIDPDAPHEVMLVVDATTGQNALHQAVQFNEILPLTGITLTKLDGTAKGGILFAIAERLNVPFRFIGVGERIEDLRHFDAEEFLDALLAP